MIMFESNPPNWLLKWGFPLRTSWTACAVCYRHGNVCEVGGEISVWEVHPRQFIEVLVELIAVEVVGAVLCVELIAVDEHSLHVGNEETFMNAHSINILLCERFEDPRYLREHSSHPWSLPYCAQINKELDVFVVFWDIIHLNLALLNLENVFPNF